MQEKEMLHDLIQESREHLLSIEPDLLELEKHGNDTPQQLINQVFRAIHSIKGGFGFFGYKHITSLAHTMEHVLSRIRDKKISISPQLIESLFSGIDKLRVILDDFENSEQISIDSELEALSSFSDDQVIHHTDNKVQMANINYDVLKYHSSINVATIDDAIRNGHTVYQIFLHSHEDIDSINCSLKSIFDKWEKIGRIVDFTLDLNSIKGLKGSTDVDMLYSVLFSSVLEPDLIAEGLSLSFNQFRIVDTEQLKVALAKQNEPANMIEKTVSTSVSESKLIDETLRVKVHVLNNLMNLAGELVLSRNQMLQQFNRKLLDAPDIEKSINDFLRAVEISLHTIKDNALKSPESVNQLIPNEHSRLKELLMKSLSFNLKDIGGSEATLQSVNSITSQLQENIMQTRLQPISIVFNKFPRVIRDLSKKLGKQIELVIVGQDVELDKSILESLSDPLTHLVRNSADHGIEKPDARSRAGKNATGKIFLTAFQESGKVIVKIEDDGKGLDLGKIKKTAVSKNIVTEQEAVSMSVREIQNLIMQPGFSTAEEVSDVSGRGVGMDVVRSNIERLGGFVEIESEFGKGMTITLTLPLTLAIIPSLIVSSEDNIFAIPQVDVDEVVRIRSFEVTKKIERIQGAEVMRLRGKLLPLVRLSDILGLSSTFIHPTTGERLPDQRARWSDRRNKQKVTGDVETDSLTNDNRDGQSDRRENVSNAVKVVVIKSGQKLYGLVVDAVYDNEEIVVKPLSDYLKSVQCYSGTTILGNGKVVMILDPEGMASKANLRFLEMDKEQQKEYFKNVHQDSIAQQEFLLFDNNSNENFGVNLGTVARIEVAEIKDIELVGNREFIKRDGGSYPLVRIHDILPVSGPKEQTEKFFVILPKVSERKVGIIAASVHDVIETSINLDTQNIKGTGVMGSTIINNKLTIILDFNSLLQVINERIG